MNRLLIPAFGIVLLFSPICFGRDKVIVPDLSKVQDPKLWTVINATCDAADEGGKTVARLTPKGEANTPSDIGLALVEGLGFAEGVLEVDLKGKGNDERMFPGFAFAVVDGRTFEAVYFRPFNFMRDGEVYRNRAVQYIAWPEHTWEKLRERKPGVYETAVKPVPDPAGWFHARIEVTKQKVRVWVEDGKEPCLIVDRLGVRTKGKVGLWVDSKEGAFRNLVIRPAA
jgi:hypothetical protein